MSAFNVTYLEGNLTKDAEVHYLDSGTVVANITVANNRKYGDKETVLFMPCVAFGKLAEILVKYGVKGKKVLVGGYLQDDSYTKSGTDEKVHRIKLYLDMVRFIGGFDGKEKDVIATTEDTPKAPDNF